MHRILIGLCWLLVGVVSPSLANPVSPPSGWTETRDGTSLSWTAPPGANGTTTILIIDEVQRSALGLKAWYEEQVQDLKKQGAKISNRLGVSFEGDLLKDVFNVEQDGVNFRTFAFAYETPIGKQTVLVMTLGDLDTKDATVQSAFDQVARLWRQKAAYNDGRTLVATKPEGSYRPANQPAPKPTPGAAGSAASGRCRDELRTINTMQLQQVCYPSAGGMSNCQLQSVPVQQQVLQTQCY